MERKDIVLKNLAEELKFTRHELIRLNRLDILEYQRNDDNDFFQLDYDAIKKLSEDLMQLLHQEDPSKSIDSQKSHRTCLIDSDAKPSQIMNLIAMAFKAGNKVIFHSSYNESHTFEFLNQCWQSVLASQGHDAEHIVFSSETMEEIGRQYDQEIDFVVRFKEGDDMIGLGDFV